MSNSQARTVEVEGVSPCGAFILGEVEQQNAFDSSSEDNRLQARAKTAGLPLCVIKVTGLRPPAPTKTYEAEMVAEHQLVPPETPIRLLAPEGLKSTACIANEPRSMIEYSQRCAGPAVPAGRQTADAPKAA